MQPAVATNVGYDPVMGQRRLEAGGNNAILRDTADNTQIYLRLQTIEATFGLAGTTGQAVLNRDFYPKNFQQVEYVLTGQAVNQIEYGDIVEFVHKSQRNAVINDGLLGLSIPAGGTWRGSHSMKGPRKGISALGYVRSVTRVHRRHEPAPTYSFNFVIAVSRAGIFQEKAATSYKLAKWSEIVESQLAGNFIKPPKTLEEQEAKDKLAKDNPEQINDLGTILTDPEPRPPGFLG